MLQFESHMIGHHALHTFKRSMDDAQLWYGIPHNCRVIVHLLTTNRLVLWLKLWNQLWKCLISKLREKAMISQPGTCISNHVWLYHEWELRSLDWGSCSKRKSSWLDRVSKSTWAGGTIHRHSVWGLVPNLSQAHLPRARVKPFLCSSTLPFIFHTTSTACRNCSKEEVIVQVCHVLCYRSLTTTYLFFGSSFESALRN